MSGPRAGGKGGRPPAAERRVAPPGGTHYYDGMDTKSPLSGRGTCVLCDRALGTDTGRRTGPPIGFCPGCAGELGIVPVENLLELDEEARGLSGVAGCPFCAIVRGQAPASVVYADALCVAFLDIHPIRDGQGIGNRE